MPRIPSDAQVDSLSSSLQARVMSVNRLLTANEQQCDLHSPDWELASVLQDIGRCLKLGDPFGEVIRCWQHRQFMHAQTHRHKDAQTHADAGRMAPAMAFVNAPRLK